MAGGWLGGAVRVRHDELVSVRAALPSGQPTQLGGKHGRRCQPVSFSDSLLVSGCWVCVLVAMLLQVRFVMFALCVFDHVTAVGTLQDSEFVAAGAGVHRRCAIYSRQELLWK